MSRFSYWVRWTVAVVLVVLGVLTFLSGLALYVSSPAAWARGNPTGPLNVVFGIFEIVMAWMVFPRTPKVSHG